MTNSKEFGEISQKEGESLFEWNLSLFWLLTQQEEDYITSPRFYLQDSSWYLALYPNGYDWYQPKGWVGLFIHRADIGYPKCIKYELGIEVNGHSKTFTKTEFFARMDDRSGEPRLLENTTLEPLNPDFLEFPEFLPDVIITCRLKEYSFNALQEPPISVSCAIQTNIPDRVSCAIQTEVPESITEEENSKDEDKSSLDTKEVTILRNRMKELLMKGSDYDVTICVQDKEFRAHRNILKARSPVFEMMLTHDTKESKTGTIIIEDCDPDTFDNFLLYVYSGKTGNLKPSKALKLYYTADKYDFPVLKERCVKLLKTSMSITSICDVVLLASKHQEEELLGAASEFFARNMEEILVSVNWQTFLVQNPLEGNELYIKSMKIRKAWNFKKV